MWAGRLCSCQQPCGHPVLLTTFVSKQTSAVLHRHCCAGNQVQVPQLIMTLGYDNTSTGQVTYTQLCTSDVSDLSQLPASETSVTSSGMVRVTAGLFQNHFQGCIPLLGQVTSFGFQNLPSNGAASPVSFCLDDISLLPTSLQPGGELSLHPWQHYLYGTCCSSCTFKKKLSINFDHQEQVMQHLWPCPDEMHMTQ